jgi:TolA-binding protein
VRGSDPSALPIGEARNPLTPNSVARRRAPTSTPAAQPDLPTPAAVSGEAPAPNAAPDAAVAPTPAPRSAELELFRRAQSLHNAHDPKCLAAWDAYLRIAEQGVLIPEARYNRALCLVRQGRKQEAEQALKPFAEGNYGDYRRTEAQVLITALQSR